MPSVSAGPPTPEIEGPAKKTTFADEPAARRPSVSKIKGSFNYASSLFSERTIQKYISTYSRILDQIINIRNINPVHAKALRFVVFQENYQTVSKILSRVDKMADKLIRDLVERKYSKIDYKYKFLIIE